MTNPTKAISHNQYRLDIASIKSKQCTKCHGLGKLDDADFGDIAHYSWPCDHCAGSGYEPTTPARAEAVLLPCPAPWQSIDTAPKDGERRLLCWNAFGNIRAHVELGWFGKNGWCNTYGKPFHGDPDRWMPLPPTEPIQTPTPTDQSLVERVAEKLAVKFSDWAILLLDIDEDSPILSRVCDEMRVEISAAIAAMPDLAEVEGWKDAAKEWCARHDKLFAEADRLRPYVDAFRREEDRADGLSQTIDDLRTQLAERDATIAAIQKLAGHLADCLTLELGGLADENDTDDEDLAAVLGVDYARHIIAARLRIRQARALTASQVAK